MFWLSRNERGLVIGKGDVEMIQFLVDDKEWAQAVLAALNYRFGMGAESE